MHKSIRNVQKKKKRETRTHKMGEAIHLCTYNRQHANNNGIIFDNPIIRIINPRKNNTNIKMKEYAINFACVAKGVIPSRIFLESPQLLFMFFILTCTCLDRTCVYLQSVMKMVFS